MCVPCAESEGLVRMTKLTAGSAQATVPAFSQW
jgi:hypothetical protein